MAWMFGTFGTIISFIVEVVVLINVIKLVLKEVKGMIVSIPSIPSTPSKPSKETTPSPPTPSKPTQPSKPTSSEGKYMHPKYVKVLHTEVIGPYRTYRMRVVCPDGTKFTDTVTWNDQPLSIDMLYCYCHYVFGQLVCMPHIYISPKYVV